MNANKISTKGLFLREKVCNYKHNNPRIYNSECLSQLLAEPKAITELSKELIHDGHEIIFMQRGITHGGIIFGAKLNPQKKLSCKTLLDFISLSDSDIELKNSLISTNFDLQSYNGHNFHSSINLVIDIFENPTDDYSTFINLFIELSKLVQFVYLRLSKKKVQFWILSYDLYELKNATKLLRDKNNNVKEFFFPRVDYVHMLNKFFTMEEIALFDDDPHRVIFDK